MNEERQHRLINIAVLIDLACLTAMIVSFVWLLSHNNESQPGNDLISISFAILFISGLVGVFVAGALAAFAVLARPSLLSTVGIIPFVLAVFFLLAIVWAVLFVRCS
ncbi:MAG: hypothetical protein MZU79_02895 [Anaerotruncus sp.]|nr:hypothetical protein [Anaerotruncus sp.]